MNVMRQRSLLDIEPATPVPPSAPISVSAAPAPTVEQPKQLETRLPHYPELDNCLQGIHDAVKAGLLTLAAAVPGDVVEYAISVRCEGGDTATICRQLSALPLSDKRRGDDVAVAILIQTFRQEWRRCQRDDPEYARKLRAEYELLRSQADIEGLDEELVS